MTKARMLALFNEKLAGEMFDRMEEVEMYFDAVIDEINAKLQSCFPILSKFNPIDFPNWRRSEWVYVTQEENKLTGALSQIEKVNDTDLQRVYENYDVFPDHYIRSVLVIGAAWKWYITDEEGNTTAPLIFQEYQQNLFEMIRDYINYVPQCFSRMHQSRLRGEVFNEKLSTKNLPGTQLPMTNDPCRVSNPYGLEFAPTPTRGVGNVDIFGN